MPLSDYNGDYSFTIGGNSFRKSNASGGKDVYSRTGSGLSGEIGTSFVSATPSQLNSTTYEDIFNETVSIGGTHAIFFKVALEDLYYGSWTFELLVGSAVVDATEWKIAYGDGYVSKDSINLMAVSSSLTSTTVQVRYIRNTGVGDADMIGTAKLIII